MDHHFRECPQCGAHLDPDEVCDCIQGEKESRPGAANTGTAEERATLQAPYPALILTHRAGGCQG